MRTDPADRRMPAIPGIVPTFDLVISAATNGSGTVALGGCSRSIA
jgi:hypothetical protein